MDINFRKDFESGLAYVKTLFPGFTRSHISIGCKTSPKYSFSNVNIVIFCAIFYKNEPNTSKEQLSVNITTYHTDISADEIYRQIHEALQNKNAAVLGCSSELDVVKIVCEYFLKGEKYSLEYEKLDENFIYECG